MILSRWKMPRHINIASGLIVCTGFGRSLHALESRVVPVKNGKWGVWIQEDNLGKILKLRVVQDSAWSPAGSPIIIADIQVDTPLSGFVCAEAYSQYNAGALYVSHPSGCAVKGIYDSGNFPLKATFDSNGDVVMLELVYHETDPEFICNINFVVNDAGEGRGELVIEENGHVAMRVWDGEPEDNTLCRNFNGVFSIPELLQTVYDAGRYGHKLKINHINNRE